MILQFDAETYSSLTDDSLPENIEALKVVHVLRQDDAEFSMMCEITPRDPNREIDFSQKGIEEVVALCKGTKGVSTYYIRTIPIRVSPKDPLLRDLGGYFVPPIEIVNGWVKITYLGNVSAIKKLLKMAEESHIPYKVSSIRDASFSSDSPLNVLTDIQREVIITAFENGYYDFPKKIGVKELATKLGIRGPTFVIHRRKAEKRIMEELMRNRRKCYGDHGS